MGKEQHMYAGPPGGVDNDGRGSTAGYGVKLRAHSGEHNYGVKLRGRAFQDRVCHNKLEELDAISCLYFDFTASSEP